jgi:hypothetical protein
LKLDKRNGILNSPPYDLPWKPSESHNAETCSKPIEVLCCIGPLILVSALALLLLLLVMAFVVLIIIPAPAIPSGPMEVLLVLILLVPRDISVFIVAAPVGQVVLLFFPPLLRLSGLLLHHISKIFDLLSQMLVMYRLGCRLSSHGSPIWKDHKLLADCVFAAKEDWLIYLAKPLRSAEILNLLSLLSF